MREESRRKLDRVLRVRRVKLGAMVLLGVCGIVGVLALLDLDASVTDRRVSGHVERVSVPATKSAMQAVAIDVELDDGHHIQVLALKSREPHVGDRIDVIEHRHGTGRVTYSLR